MTKVKSRNEDAYGQELLAQHKGATGLIEIVERGDYLISTGSSLARYFSTFDDWRPHEQEAIGLAHGRVLDIGCGAGRHSLYLQCQGFDVTGIDNSPGAVKVCKLRGLKKIKLRPISDLGKFGRESFDTVLMLGNNFGLFASRRQAKVTLKRLYRITSEKALIIAESTDPYKTKVRDHLDYRKANISRGRMAGQIKIRVRFGRTIGPWFDYLLVSEREMAELLENTGWRVERVIPSEGTPQYIAVIRKDSVDNAGI